MAHRSSVEGERKRESQSQQSQGRAVELDQYVVIKELYEMNGQA
jgi:hypothetical protein